MYLFFSLFNISDCVYISKPIQYDLRCYFNILLDSSLYSFSLTYFTSHLGYCHIIFGHFAKELHANKVGNNVKQLV